jgi:outer membrane protein TolC
VGIPSALTGQALPPKPALADLVAYALRLNADMVTARLRTDSAHGEQRIARALPNPAYSIIPGTPFQYAVTQPLDLGPARLFRTRAAARGLGASQLDAQDMTRQVTFNVEQAYFDLLLAEAVRDVAVGQRDVFRQLLAADSIRLRHGDIPQRDVTATELQASRAEANLARISAGARAARMALQLVVGVKTPDTAFRVSGALEYRKLDIPLGVSLDSLRALALARRPDLAAARLRVEQSRALRSLATANLIPVPGITGVYQPDPFATGSHYAIGLSLSLPVLYWFGGERERARAGVTASEVAAQHTEARTTGELTLATENFGAARSLAERYTGGGLLERSRAAVEMQRFAYQQGAASLLDFLTALGAFGDIQTDYLTALHDYWVSAYAINSAVGGGLIP